jgi:Dihydropteroate synthase (EC 2.5.1.15)
MRRNGRASPRFSGGRALERPGFGDTYQPETMRRALDLGADIINDIHALQRPGALEVVAASKAGVCLMHMQAIPPACSRRRTMRTF